MLLVAARPHQSSRGWLSQR
uniref:Uncharacterized protein n=1 Tax=Arundo donax TaxID=35708 RepID=A0A0A8ZMG8_ARUDO